MVVLFDLDGVIRDLDGIVEETYDVKWTDWNGLIDGKNIITIVSENPRFLVYSLPTQFYGAIMELIPKPIILTHQVAEWQELTKIWMAHYLPGCYYEFLTTAEKIGTLDAFNTQCADTILIEDHPKIDYAKNKMVYMVEKPYNTMSNCPAERRIRSVGEMYELLEHWRC